MTWGYIAVAAATVVGGVLSSQASKKASNAQTSAVDSANATTLAMYNQNRADAAPYRESGYQALASLNQGLGLPGAGSQPLGYDEWLAQNPQATVPAAPAASAPAPKKKSGGLFGKLLNPTRSLQAIVDPVGATIGATKDVYGIARDAAGNPVSTGAPTDPHAAYADYVKNFTPSPQADTGTPTGDFNRDFTLADFQKDPGYQFRMDEGQNALESSASARGGVLNGGTAKALERYGQDYASGEYSNAYNRFNNDRTTRFNRLSSLAGTGQTAVTNVGVLGTNAANNIAGNTIDAGNARAAGIVGQNNAITGGLQTLGNYYLNRQYGYAPPPRSVGG